MSFRRGLFALILYLIIYILQTFLFFLFIIFIRDKSTNLNLTKIEQLKSFVHTNKLLGYMFAINLFSMAGLPPLAGFLVNFLYLNV